MPTLYTLTAAPRFRFESATAAVIFALTIGISAEWVAL